MSKGDDTKPRAVSLQLNYQHCLAWLETSFLPDTQAKQSWSLLHRGLRPSPMWDQGFCFLDKYLIPGADFADVFSFERVELSGYKVRKRNSRRNIRERNKTSPSAHLAFPLILHLILHHPKGIQRWKAALKVHVCPGRGDTSASALWKTIDSGGMELCL